MTTLDLFVPPRPAAPERPSTFGALFAALRRRRRARRQLADLADLPDYLLADVGLTRADVLDHRAPRPFAARSASGAPTRLMLW
jgi:uncharacterized protein YjiS (DUF1127 family)